MVEVIALMIVLEEFLELNKLILFTQFQLTNVFKFALIAFSAMTLSKVLANGHCGNQGES